MKNLEEVRNSIIEAAEKHFSILGFEKTTLDDITGENGRSKTSIYYHFKNKHEIFKSVIEKEFNEVRAELQKIIDDKERGRVEGMREYLRTRLETLQKQGAYKRFASSRFAYGENPVSKVVNDARKSFDMWERQYLELSITNGIEEGSIPGSISPQVFSNTLINVLKALEVQFFSSNDKEEVENTYKGMIELMVR
ncbi:MAG: TetR/AcrR family transcriptional regulator [Bacteroidia bacterium]|nr:TetR/AcrR family transcriptional regulator [Bacteroidia bacterium]